MFFHEIAPLILLSPGENKWAISNDVHEKHFLKPQRTESTSYMFSNKITRREDAQAPSECIRTLSRSIEPVLPER